MKQLKLRHNAQVSSDHKLSPATNSRSTTGESSKHQNPKKLSLLVKIPHREANSASTAELHQNDGKNSRSQRKSDLRPAPEAQSPDNSTKKFTAKRRKPALQKEREESSGEPPQRQEMATTRSSPRGAATTTSVVQKLRNPSLRAGELY